MANDAPAVAPPKPEAVKEAPKETGLSAAWHDAYDFVKTAKDGFCHEVVKPFVGATQIVTGQTGAEIDPQTAEKSTVAYSIGSMAGQATDFLAMQVVAKKLGITPKVTSIIASGTLAALNTTDAGGHTLASIKERGENFLVGAVSMAAYEGANAGLRHEGLRSGLGNGLLREAGSGAFAGYVSANANSLIKTGELADEKTTYTSMLGWAAAGAAFHAVGAGASRLTSELKPELMARTGRLQATPVEGGTAREFVVTSGKADLDSFTSSNARGTNVTVREILPGENGKVTLGSRQNMLVQHLSANEGDGRLLPGAKRADVIATCHPENLSEATRAKHVFSEKQGNVWLFKGNDNRLLLSAGETPVNVTNVNGYKEPFKLNRGETTIFAMAPLLVGNPSDMNSPESQAALADYRRQLQEAKQLKIDGVSMDFWWGMVNKEKGKFDFSYFHLFTDEVIKAGLDVATVLSFHQCGGNVGDTENIPIPQWVWKDIAEKLGSTDENIGKFKSEQGHYSPEYIQGWADKVAVNYYADVMNAYRDSFKAKAPYISEVNISLGPSGEMRYPSYNSHDQNVGYPTRGAFQGYSDLAVQDFRNWALAKYGNADAVGNAWGIKDLKPEDIRPPQDANGFFDRADHINTKYGQDLIDWYNGSLVQHGKTVLSKAVEIFGAPDSPFLGTAVGGKIPGVHWRMGWRNGDNVTFSDRAAEVNAGLIRTSQPWTAENAYGYANILNMFKSLQPAKPGISSPVIPSYTCLELPDGQDGPAAQSLPHTAATRFGIAAKQWGLMLRGENALSGTLYNGADWDLMDNQVITSLQPERFYNGLTLLRLHDVVDNPVGRQHVSDLIRAIHATTNVQQQMTPVLHAAE
jgi:beta-amylase